MKLSTAEMRRDPKLLRELVLSAATLLRDCGSGLIPSEALALIEEDLACATLIARTIQNEREIEEEEG